MRNLLTRSPLAATVAVALSVLLLALTFVFNSTDRAVLADAMPAVQAVPASQNVAVTIPEFDAANLDEDVLWMARCIFSETKRPEEQELIAWVLRNRVETGYRGKRSYRSTVLDPMQFSAFNANSPKRRYYAGLAPTSSARGWQTALRIAHEVYYSPETARPFSRKTRHFYSERSMVGRSQPVWADGKRPVSLDRDVDPRRFRFFAGVS
jgi:hypothetical protein